MLPNTVKKKKILLIQVKTNFSQFNMVFSMQFAEMKLHKAGAE